MSSADEEALEMLVRTFDRVRFLFLEERSGVE
jgi:hypothetical protein